MKRAAAAAAMALCFLQAGAAVRADPIHDAAGGGSLEKLERFLDAGASVNARDANGMTPLHEAAMWGHRDVVELLLSKGADVDARDMNGWTPLHFAANGDHAKLAAVLVGKGATVDARARNGWTPLHIAAVWGHTNVAKVLIAGGADVNTPVGPAAGELRAPARADRCHKDVPALLEKKGMGPGGAGGTGMTPLRLAVLNGQKDMAELLERSGARR